MCLGKNVSLKLKFKINLSSLIFKLKKCYIPKNGVEFHQESIGNIIFDLATMVKDIPMKKINTNK